MDVKELEAAFDAGVEILKQQLNAEGHSDPMHEVILGGVLLLKEFLVDHKRSADALEKLASNTGELDQYRHAFGSLK